jgi:hypothetical protein
MMQNSFLWMLFLIPVSVLVLFGNSSAADTTWTGNTSNSWTTAGNWGNGIPCVGGHAVIDENVSGNPVSCFPVIRSNTGAINILSLSRNYAGTSRLTMEDGSNLSVTGYTRLGHVVGSLGILTVNGGLLQTYTLHVGFNSQMENAAGDGRLYLNGGIVQCVDLGFGEDFPDFAWGHATGVIDVSGGQLRISNDVTANIANKVASGQIIAYGGNGTVVYDYNHTNAVYTTVMGLPPVRDINSDMWVAVDALKRQLPGFGQVGPVRQNKFVGIFYWIWHYETSGGPYDITQLIAANPANPQWGPVYATHHWGQSELGYYDSADPYVVRKHASMLSDAGVDVIIFDTTNSPYTWQDQYIALCSEFRRIRSQGGQTPQIAFMAPFGNSAAVVQSLYDNLYAPGLYTELWFRWDGKPLLLADRADFSGNPAIYNFFTFRKPMPSYFTGPTGPDQWGWLEVYPQHAFYDSTGSLEQVTVGVAQNAAGSSLAFMSHKNGAMGRSWHNGHKEADNAAVNYGYNFAEQWQRALNLDPEFIFVTGWNEWTSMRFLEWAGYTGSNSYYPNALFIDQYNQEYSRDIEPMVQGYTDNYYYQMIDNIRRFKGIRKPQAASPAKTIIIDGDFSDWDNVAPEYRDNIGDTIHRSFPGYGSTYYTNTTGRNDLITTKVACNERYVYFYAETADTLTSHTDPNWMLLFIDVDRNKATGWEGYDYLVNSEVLNSAATTLKRTTAGWNWTLVSEVSYKAKGNKLEIKIPRSSIGKTGQTAIDFDFHWADNIQNNNIIEFSVSGDSAPNRRFDYHYENNVYSYLFDVDGNYEGWYFANHLAGAVAAGILRCNIIGVDPYMYGGDVTIDTVFHKYLHLRMKNSTFGTGASFYWITNNDGNWNENKSVHFAITPNDNCFKDYWIDLSVSPKWTDMVTKIRVDPSANANSGLIDIDLIALTDARTDFGDINIDGCVDSEDIRELAGCWLEIEPHTSCDFNNDCCVNFVDFVLLASHWLQCG